MQLLLLAEEWTAFAELAGSARARYSRRFE